MRPVEADISFPEVEQRVLKFWNQENIFQRSMDPFAPTGADGGHRTEPRPTYVFYDGPPFATGLPHYGHLLAGTIKDVIGRFFTMKGFHVDRRFGWDCHGVPVEFEIQKALNLHGSKAIREFGVGRFNEECRKIVLRYTREWRQFVERSGRWVDFEREYRTMDLGYMESIWWAVRSLWDRGLIYEGVKCVPYSWAINTPLSNFETNLNYKTVQDPAITVRFPLRGDIASRFNVETDKPWSAYVWTTTPWTIPSNMALAVGPDMPYVAVLAPDGNEVVVIAKSRAAEIFPGQELSVLGEVIGQQLEGLEYTPPFSYFEEERSRNAFRVYAEPFVTADEGTGIVHCASFGEEDLQVFLKRGIAIIDPVDADGNFTQVAADFAGLNIKAADPKVVAALKSKRLLVSHQTIEHSYPFCWRTDTPLMYRSISTWFVRVESIRDLLVHNNMRTSWVPEHVRDGRFGKWLENARDWAISRNRFWGTPIPIWRCSSCGATECIGSVAELQEKSGSSVNDLHSHFVDELSWGCQQCSGGTMRRIPEVLDCWFESGAMPYAQVHYPFDCKEEFEQSFPADFIAEGLDQTRGWFYTLLVLSTALFGRPAFKNVVVNGIVLAEDGKKMSKSLKNYPPPDEVMNEFGADAMRLYLLASAATRAEDLRFSKSGVKQVVRQTLLPLWNAYNFLVTYAQVDRWTPAEIPEQSSRNILDRWILSKARSLAESVDAALSSYRLYLAAPTLLDFVDQLTNWYIRLNRRRFWAGSGEASQDKLHAYATLHQALLLFCRVLAPLAPFVSEEIFQNLKLDVKGLDFDSVHLAPFPRGKELDSLSIDADLEATMELFEEVIILGRSVRQREDLKLRQPLAEMTVVYPAEISLQRLQELDSYIRDELNVKRVVYSCDEGAIVTLKAKLNTKTLGAVLGPKLGSDGMRKLRQRVEGLSTEEIRAFEQQGTLVHDDIELKAGDILVEREPRPGMKAAASSGQLTVVLDTTLSQELRLEGLAREFVNRVQKLRKDLQFEVSDRIIVKYMTACPRLTLALSEHRDYVSQEVLAVALEEVQDQDVLRGQQNLSDAQEIEGRKIIISLSRTQA